MAHREPDRVGGGGGVGGGNFSNSFWEVRELELNYLCEGTAAWSLIDIKGRR